MLDFFSADIASLLHQALRTGGQLDSGWNFYPRCKGFLLECVWGVGGGGILKLLGDQRQGRDNLLAPPPPRCTQLFWMGGGNKHWINEQTLGTMTPIPTWIKQTLHFWSIKQTYNEAYRISELGLSPPAEDSSVTRKRVISSVFDSTSDLQDKEKHIAMPWHAENTPNPAAVRLAFQMDLELPDSCIGRWRTCSITN